MDDVDRAKQYEMQHRKRSLNAALSVPEKSADEKQAADGQSRIICIDCQSVIPLERLNMRPDIVRCVDCKAAWEKKQK